MTIKRWRKSGNILWLAPFTFPLVFLGIFVRAHYIGDDSMSAAILYGLGGLAFTAVCYVMTELWRRMSEGRKHSR